MNTSYNDWEFVVDGFDKINPAVSLADEVGICKSAMAAKKRKLSEPGMEEPDNDWILNLQLGKVWKIKAVYAAGRRPCL